MIEQLVSRVFAARNAALREHFRTCSYSQHVALGEFYEEIIEAIDAVVEVHQGCMGLIGPFTVVDVKTDTITSYILAEATWIESNRAKFSSSPAVQNRIDDLTAIYHRTHSKLMQLR